jgi:hypothetical protein
MKNNDKLDNQPSIVEELLQQLLTLEPDNKKRTIIQKSIEIVRQSTASETHTLPSFGKIRSKEIEETFEEFLRLEPPENRERILRIVQKTNVRPNDPMFLALIAITQGRLAINSLPGRLEEIQRNLILFNTRIEDNLMQLIEATKTLRSEEQNRNSFSKTDIWDIAFRAAFAGTVVGALVISALAKLFS